MATVRYLGSSAVAETLAEVDLRPALEAAMDGFSAGRADVPPRVAADSGLGWLGAMPGYLAGVGMAAKLVTVFPDNVDSPSHQGLITVFDPATGTPLAIMDAEHITEARTAMTAAIATDLMARNDADVLTIVGGGAQAMGHAKTFTGLRPWGEVRVCNRTQSAAVVVAGEAKHRGAESVVVYEDLQAAVHEADVVALCTHAGEAVIDAEWIRPGVHVSSVGSAAELPVALAQADVVVVEWRDCVVVPPPAGAAELQQLDSADVIELGDLVAARTLGRTADDQVTVYKSTGHAVQDIAAAQLVFQQAVAADRGIELEL